MKNTATNDRPVNTPFSSRITEAESKIIHAIVRGASNIRIAYARGTSPRTVANQVASIFRKLQVTSRRELLALMYRLSNGDGRVTAWPVGLLSRREHEVLRRVSAGQSNKLIAHDLGLQPGTVAALLARASAKLATLALQESVNKMTIDPTLKQG